MDRSTLEDAILGMDRRKVKDEVTSAAKSGLDAAAGIGTETPMVVLKDIRRCILDLSEMIRESERLEQTRETRAEQRHNEMIATLQQISIRASDASNMQRSSLSRSSLGSINEGGSKRLFYHWDDEIKTGPQIIAVIFMQLDMLLRNSGRIPDSGEKDAVVLGLKGWSSPIIKIAAIESIVTSRNMKLELPKLAQQETIAALEIVSSTEKGRSQPFRTVEAVRLQQSCAGVMGIVEEIRQRFMKCPGMLPEGKRQTLACLKYPYTTRDEDLNINMVPEGYVTAGPIVTDSIPKLKDNAKKFYVAEVLGKGTAPILAYNKSKAVT